MADRLSRELIQRASSHTGAELAGLDALDDPPSRGDARARDLGGDLAEAAGDRASAGASGSSSCGAAGSPSTCCPGPSRCSSRPAARCSRPTQLWKAIGITMRRAAGASASPW